MYGKNGSNMARTRYEQTFKRLEKSKFRAGFHLDSKDKEYVTAKGTDKIREHAEDFIEKNVLRLHILQMTAGRLP